MRAARIMAGIALVHVIGSVALGQTPPFDATISIPEAEVRSGPSSSPNFYLTSKLRQGTKVHVIEEKNGWLAITPPPGSFSWISGLVIDRTGRTAVVRADGAPVRIGSALVDQEPTIEQVKLSRGTQVVLLGSAKDGKWWPIEPPPQEVRYIPKDAIRVTPAVETVSNSPSAEKKNSGWTTPGAAGGATTPSLQQAEQAEKAGQVAEAIRLYEQAGREVTNSNHDLAMRCFRQAQCLREGRTGSFPAGYQPGVPAQASTGGPPRFAPIAGYPTGSPAPGQLTSQGQAAGYPPPPVNPPLQSSGLGRLRRAGFNVDGKQAYVLENSQGRPLYYITSQSSLNLEPYVNHIINLVGVAVYRGDLRSNYMTASGVSQVVQ